jgi:hypothetical protein
MTHNLGVGLTTPSAYDFPMPATGYLEFETLALEVAMPEARANISPSHESRVTATVVRGGGTLA